MESDLSSTLSHVSSTAPAVPGRDRNECIIRRCIESRSLRLSSCGVRSSHRAPASARSAARRRPPRPEVRGIQRTDGFRLGSAALGLKGPQQRYWSCSISQLLTEGEDTTTCLFRSKQSGRRHFVFHFTTCSSRWEPVHLDRG